MQNDDILTENIVISLVCSVNHKIACYERRDFNGKLNYHLRLRAASDFFLRLTLGFS